MVKLEKICAETFPGLYSAFLHDDDPLSDEQDWRNVFNYSWDTEQDLGGYALVDSGKVIGMMGMVFSERVINSQRQKFCNLHTWWVHKDHRGRSLMMMRPLLKLEGFTITHFTPCDKIRALTKRLGFVDLNLQQKVLLPIFGNKGKRSLRSDLVSFDDDVIVGKLDEHDHTIFQDHQPYRVGSLVVQEGDQHCYILYTHVVRFRIEYCHIHYVGNRKLFAENEVAVRMALMQKHRVRFVIIDSRLSQDIKFRRSFDFWAPAHAVYKPCGGVAPNQVDNLYSDVVMLRLCILPHISHELKETARRWLPFGKG